MKKKRNANNALHFVRLVIMVHLVLCVKVSLETQIIFVNVLKVTNKMVLIVKKHSQVNQLK